MLYGIPKKEQKNSPDDMETITMWAVLSSNVVDARLKRPRGTTSETVIISMDDAAKIRENAKKAEYTLNIISFIVG